ncbi:MAG TPA: site-2 protease family protein [Streptosporangiaceae bacterium]
MTTTRTPERPPAPAPGGEGPGRANRERRTSGLRVRLTAGAYVLAALAVGVSALSLPAAVPGQSTGAYLSGGIVIALLLVGSLVLHEIGHALVARRHGERVEEISVGFAGGSRHGLYELSGPRAQWRVAAAGPAVSLVLAALLGGAAAGLAALGSARLAVIVMTWMAIANAAIGVLGLLPGAGPDGGRIVRAVTWARTGNPAGAGLVAARAGQVTGGLLVAGGLAVVALGYALGLWVTLIGVLAFMTSRGQARQLLAAAALTGLRVRDVIGPTAQESAPAWQSVEEFIAEHPAGMTAMPLREFDGSPAGLLTVSQLAPVQPDRRAALRLRDVATPIVHVVTTTSDELLTSLLERLSSWPRIPAAVHTAGHALVLDAEGKPSGVLTPADVARAGWPGRLPVRLGDDLHAGGPVLGLGGDHRRRGPRPGHRAVPGHPPWCA